MQGEEEEQFVGGPEKCQKCKRKEEAEEIPYFELLVKVYDYFEYLAFPLQSAGKSSCQKRRTCKLPDWIIIAILQAAFLQPVTKVYVRCIYSKIIAGK